MFSISQDPKFSKKLYIKYQSRHKIFKKHMFSISQDPKFSKKLSIKYQSRHKIFKKHMFSISQDTYCYRNRMFSIRQSHNCLALTIYVCQQVFILLNWSLFRSETPETRSRSTKISQHQGSRCWCSWISWCRHWILRFFETSVVISSAPRNITG